MHHAGRDFVPVFAAFLGINGVPQADGSSGDVLANTAWFIARLLAITTIASVREMRQMISPVHALPESTSTSCLDAASEMGLLTTVKPASADAFAVRLSVSAGLPCWQNRCPRTDRRMTAYSAPTACWPIYRWSAIARSPGGRLVVLFPVVRRRATLIMNIPAFRSNCPACSLPCGTGSGIHNFGHHPRFTNAVFMIGCSTQLARVWEVVLHRMIA